MCICRCTHVCGKLKIPLDFRGTFQRCWYFSLGKGWALRSRTVSLGSTVSFHQGSSDCCRLWGLRALGASSRCRSVHSASCRTMVYRVTRWLALSQWNCTLTTVQAGNSWSLQNSNTFSCHSGCSSGKECSQGVTVSTSVPTWVSQQEFLVQTVLLPPYPHSTVLAASPLNPLHKDQGLAGIPEVMEQTIYNFL